jgi:NAD(P)-dependent dehydrogenase (short-subunit alcohol dehydrogenase family)
MKHLFKDKVVIITGASSGIGEATAREFAKHGSIVVLAARSEAKLKIITEELEKEGGKAFYIRTDVSCETDCRNLIEKTVERFGTVDILVNNAGISMRASFIDVDLKVLHSLMDVNFWGTVYCTKYALPYLLKNKGSLIGVSSVAGFHGLPGRTGYSASKFAIHGFLETIRIENLKKGLHVMIIAPGLKGIRKKKRNKILTWEGRLTALFQRIIPAFVDWAYYIEMSKEPDSPLK